MKTILIILFLFIPASIQTAYPQPFHNWNNYSRFWKIQKYHGAVAVYSDFSHFINETGEECWNHGRW